MCCSCLVMIFCPTIHPSVIVSAEVGVRMLPICISEYDTSVEVD